MSQSAVIKFQNPAALGAMKSPTTLALAISAALLSPQLLAADDSAMADDRNVERIEVTGSRTQG